MFPIISSGICDEVHLSSAVCPFCLWQAAALHLNTSGIKKERERSNTNVAQKCEGKSNSEGYSCC
jgi:hypothetical protein